MKRTSNPNYSIDANKDTLSRQIIQQIRKLFLDGGKYTARQLNELTRGNDSRKIISILRHKERMNIVDCRLPDGCKLYWLAEKGGNDE
nr:hypothetical protein [uncultured Bacteroides sp.]